MAKTKSSKVITKSRGKSEVKLSTPVAPVNFATEPMRPRVSSAKIVIALALTVLVLFGWRYRGLIIAGTVDNRPIWRWDFENRMVARSGQSVFEEIVNETILRNEAAKKGISVSNAEVDIKIAEIEKSLNGTVKLADALSQQGLTMEEFKKQVGLQLIVEKMTADNIKVTDDEVSKYIETNKTFLTATDEAVMREEAKRNLIAEKRSTEFQKIFEELKKKASVKSYFQL